MIQFPTSPEEFVQTRMLCRFGITEALGALGATLGIGSADAALGAGAAGAAGAADAGGLGAIVGTGEGLAGGATGLAGTALAGGSNLAGDALLGTAGLGALGTGADFLAAPGAGAAGGGFGAGADAAATSAAATGLPSGLGGIAATPTNEAALSELVSGAVSGASPIAGLSSSPLSGPGVSSTGSSVFNTGAAPISGLSAGPAGPAAPGAVAPIGGGAGTAGVTSDLTSAAGAGGAPGTAISGASGATSLGGPAGPSPLTGGTPNFLDKIVAGAGDTITKNALPAAIGAGGLLYNVLQNNKPVTGTPQLTQIAGQQAAQGQQLESYLTTGTLPAGLQASVDAATKSAKATAISNAAKQGLSTDPSQNTALATQLASIDQQASITTGELQEQLLSTGISETGLSTGVYGQLASIDQTEQQQVAAAIQNFARGLAGGGINLKVA